MNDLNVLLSGVVGSTAYGLAGPGSDVDRLGIFAAPSVEFFGLHRPKESHVGHDPDVTMHEVGKFCRLALAGNPTVMELLWLPDDLHAYEVRTPLGQELVSIRKVFLSGPRVRNAYLGYATQQFHRLDARGDGSFSADLRKRTAKHARHLARLLYQGLILYHHGHLAVRLPDREAAKCRDLGERAAAGELEAVRRVMADYEEMFAQVNTALPDQPDVEVVDAWLRGARRQLLTAEVPDVVRAGIN